MNPAHSEWLTCCIRAPPLSPLSPLPSLLSFSLVPDDTAKYLSKLTSLLVGADATTEEKVKLVPRTSCELLLVLRKLLQKTQERVLLLARPGACAAVGALGPWAGGRCVACRCRPLRRRDGKLVAASIVGALPSGRTAERIGVQAGEYVLGAGGPDVEVLSNFGKVGK
ncbi:hypothetical protein HYQ46_005463 [Verticillium longisporum]|nr:hypothetical protein HYQ46_005463 [Verticillium longisporum]